MFTILLPNQFLIHYLSQTLITLNLGYNEIGDQGVEHLANMLQQNKVISLSLFCYLFDCCFIFLTDNYNSKHCLQSNSWSRSKIHWDCAPKKQGDTLLIVLVPIQLLVHYFYQTLTPVNLVGNQLGGQGVEHLANALQQNKVTSFSLFCFLPNC